METAAAAAEKLVGTNRIVNHSGASLIIDDEFIAQLTLDAGNSAMNSLFITRSNGTKKGLTGKGHSIVRTHGWLHSL